MNTLKTYNEFYRDTLEWWKKEHPYSTPPRNHVISMLYDDYLGQDDDEEECDCSDKSREGCCRNDDGILTFN